MRTLPLSFTILQVLGLWAPSHFSSLWTRRLYKLYTSMIIIFLSFYIFTGIISLILTGRTINDISRDGCRLMSSSIAFGKLLNLLIHRDEIIDIIEILETDPCAPRDSEEISIQNEHNRKFRNTTIQYGMICNLTISMLLSHAILHDVPARKLPRKTWIPYDYSNSEIYWILFPLQVTIVVYIYVLTVGFNTLICGMFHEISVKLIILKYRFINLNETFKKKCINHDGKSVDTSKIEKIVITDCVTYHLCLFNLAKRINSTFNLIIFLQYVMSTILICLTVYTISGMKVNSSGCIYVSFYLLVIVIEIFLFCVYADEVTIESQNTAESVFAMGWSNFTRATWRSALIIGCQSNRPIIFSTGYFLNLSLESFKSIIKIAYSIYNAMQSLH